MLSLAKSEAFHAVRFDGKVYDTGSKLGFLAANVAYAMARPDISADFRKVLGEILGQA
jgi:UTP--glucose-1-phosphate uridylyltransferase